VPTSASPPRPESADYTLHRILLGTHTSGQAQDQLIIAQVAIPKAVEGTLQEYDDERGGAFLALSIWSDRERRLGIGLPSGLPASRTADLVRRVEPPAEIGSHTGPPARLKVVQTINHAGEINRARYMPQNPNLLATKTTSGEVFIFDRTKHASEAGAGAGCKPDIRLTGQSREGCVLLGAHAERYSSRR
jgi:histone-binding protein RBBP4